MNTLTIKNKQSVTLDFDVTRSALNDASLYLNTPIRFEQGSFDSYISDAKKFIDTKSKTLNKIGIKRLLAALVFEVIGNDYYGKEN